MSRRNASAASMRSPASIVARTLEHSVFEHVDEIGLGLGNAPPDRGTLDGGRRAAEVAGRHLHAHDAPAERTEHLEGQRRLPVRSEEHTSELQSLMRISYAVFCLKKKTTNK